MCQVSIHTCVLCMFCAYFCCNDISSSRIANFPATGKWLLGYWLLVVRTINYIVILPIAISSGKGGNYLFYFCKKKMCNFYERPWTEIIPQSRVALDMLSYSPSTLWIFERFHLTWENRFRKCSTRIRMLNILWTNAINSFIRFLPWAASLHY